MSGFAPVSNWHAPLRRFCRPQTTSNAIVFASRKHGPTHPTRTTPLGGVEAGGSHGLQRRGRAAIEAREAKATATGGTDPHGAFLSRLLRHAARHDCAADHNPFFRQALSPTCQACQTEVGPQVKCPKQHLNIRGTSWRQKQDGSARGPFRLGSQRPVGLPPATGPWLPAFTGWSWSSRFLDSDETEAQEGALEDGWLAAPDRAPHAAGAAEPASAAEDPRHGCSNRFRCPTPRL